MGSKINLVVDLLTVKTIEQYMEALGF